MCLILLTLSGVCIAFLLRRTQSCTWTLDEIVHRHLSLPPSCDSSYPATCQRCYTFTLFFIGGKSSSYTWILRRTLQPMSVSRVLCFSTETIPFFPDDVTSTFGPLVGAWASTGIVFQQASGCPVGGRGLDRRGGDVTAQESCVLWMVVATVAGLGLKEAPRAPWTLDPFLHPSDRLLTLPVPEA